MSKFTPVKDANDNVVDYSDGYHTFAELYEHRIALWIALCKRMAGDPYYIVWKSKLHSDGSNFEGWFLLCLECTETGQQISYHLPEAMWEACSFALTHEKAPYFDGHTSKDVLARLKGL